MKIIKTNIDGGERFAFLDGNQMLPFPVERSTTDVVEDLMTVPGVIPKYFGSKPLAFESKELGIPLHGNFRVICAGLNYPAHAEEAKVQIPPEPLMFVKLASTLVSPQAPIRIPNVTRALDYEGELAVIIGRKCHNVSVESALDYVLGYCVINEVTARDLQRRSPSNGVLAIDWFSGKCIDETSPIGPCIVTREEIEDPQSLDLTTSLNGKVVQRANTGEMIFSVRELISYTSHRVCLGPFDVICTGTPSGVGLSTGRYLSVGDHVSVSVSGVGLLANEVK